MPDIRFESIHSNIDEFQHQIDAFFKSLDTEREFFRTADKEMILKSELLIAAIDQQSIVGLASLVKRWPVHKAYTVVKKEYQTKGIGGFLYLKRNVLAKSRFNLALSFINPENTRSLEINSDMGSRNVGKRFGGLYMALPYNRKGLLLLLLLFPRRWLA